MPHIRVMTKATTELFDNITVNLTTGSVAYPKLEGFELDMERVYSTTKLFAPHCGGDFAMAVKHAVHQQLVAFKGTVAMRAMFGGAS